jgi:hypothetical protein
MRNEEPLVSQLGSYGDGVPAEKVIRNNAFEKISWPRERNIVSNKAKSNIILSGPQHTRTIISIFRLNRSETK